VTGDIEDRQLRAAIYVRVSTEEQATEGYSIDGQIDRLKHHVMANNWILAKIYADEGESGRKSDRPAYQLMIRERDLWDVVTILKMDRIHRNQKNFTAMMDDLAKWGKDFDSVAEKFDTGTAMGRFVMNIIQGIAQLESEQIGERTSFGLSAAFELRGKRAMGTQAPYAYSWSKGHPKWGTGELAQDKTIEKLPQGQALSRPDLVKLIYEMSAAGNGLGTITRTIGWCTCKPGIMRQKKVLANKKEVVYETHGVKNNCSGCLRARYILNNPFYCGYQVYQGKILKGTHKPVIDRSLFEAAQARRRIYRVVLPAEDV